MTDLLSYSTCDRLETTRRKTQEIKQVFLFTNPTASANQPIKAAFVKLQNQVATELRSQGFTVLEVPTGLEFTEAIAWINRRASSSDVALSIQTDAFSNPDARGIAAFYRAGNQNRRQQARQLIDQILTNVPNWVDRGERPDTDTAFGSLPFIRQAKIPAIVLSVGFATSPQDRAIIVNGASAIAKGIASGVALWSRTPSPVNFSVNGKTYDRKGVIVEGNAYLPIELLNQLRIDIQRPRAAQLLTDNNVTYIRAIDLRASGVAVGWNSTRRTVVLRTMPPLNLSKLSRIMGRGYLSKNTLKAFLQQNNPEALGAFPKIAELYLEEASIEGVNPDIAFTQALIETNFFRFGGKIQPSRNNFAALSEVGSVSESAVFPNVRTGVRAHIQLLKAYASMEPFAQAIVTPRFRFIARGIAPRIEQLERYYSDDPFYAEKILATLGQLYQYQFARSM
ncbi:MAG: N-acetylmuramoyl-L-alanine amidase [Plectolyngbya sp. WJT66-NPBG17]|nr:N-acetylmuramoyl-L-alanine amidase [Plectolyngbya sp. WJT66-NPBG17]MBW4527955.1 N-acetylmuramoyl-L-alanine amidase [Phormidium tanganyikae FI6-MK23]